MRDIIVGNFTNVLTNSVIVTLLSFLTIGVLHHSFSDLLLTDSSTEDSSKLRQNAIKSLANQTIVETLLQSYSFLTNPALRSFKFMGNKIIQSSYRSFCKKILKQNYQASYYFEKRFFQNQQALNLYSELHG